MNNETKTQQTGIAIMRVALGIIFVAHSLYLKLVVFTLPGTAAFFGSLGLPELAAYLVFFGEALGGTALIVGLNTRLVAALLVPIALGATWVHFGNGWLFTNAGGGWEYPLYLALAAVGQSFMGSGAYAVPWQFDVRGFRFQRRRELIAA